MRVGKARRRWIRWCRYVQATNTLASPSRRWGTGIHGGQAKAYEDVMFAQRPMARGVRVPWYPKWGSAR